MSLSHSLVRDLVGTLIGASEVFRRYDIDFYRIGGLKLSEAAARQKISLDRITEDLSTLAPNPSPPPTSMFGLMTYIDTRYRTVHRKQLLDAMDLAKAVEADRAIAPLCPAGLSKTLALLFDTLEDHQDNEENNLFPAMINSPRHTLRYPVCRAISEHDEISDQLDTIARSMRGYITPQGSPRSLQALYGLCSALDGDIRLHMHLENNLLFPPFAGDADIAS